ncbi:outer membrane protein assembly factor BamC [Pontibacterium sp. N1Y112]|uniref:Outer membrane protein assembly factor BamC n=1 Tax=Pontibacterium sinense TaxID=2781979 RepID=A0A8J7FG29_9GAMM|nr:outer membrane protein assembly factor BamC [Pontibacterium sinense]MBE9399457.1 outer membrane protein assembly factor BamC [Pontibacterium sinense]
MKKAVSLTILACALQAGCSVVENNPIYGDSGIIRDRSQDYEKASEGKALEVPPHLRTRETSQGMAIPDISQVATQRNGDFEIPRPEFFYTEASSDKVSLSRDGAEKLIVVESPINEVWPKLKDFWAYNGIELEKADARNAQMETVWIENNDSQLSFVDSWIKRLTFQDVEGPAKDKLRLELRPDKGDLTRTSISMKHVRFAQSDEIGQIDWEQSGRDVGYKSDMMYEMLRYLSKASDKEDAPTLTKLGQDTGGRTELGRDSRGNPVLKVEDSTDKAWDSVAAAMATDRFDLGTVDKDAGMFYFSYTTSIPVDETEKMGFFEWLHSDKGSISFKATALGEALGAGPDENAKKIRYTSKTLSEDDRERLSQMSQEEIEQEALQKEEGFKIWFAGKVIYVFNNQVDGPEGTFNEQTEAYDFVGRYQLKLNRARSGVYLTVLTEDGLSAPAQVAEEILWDVKDNLPRG